MNSVDASYERLAHLYLRLIRLHSAKAAYVVQQIQDAFGDHTAYRATLALTYIMLELRDTGSPSEIEGYYFFLAHEPAAIPLFDRAAAYFLADYYISESEVQAYASERL